MHGCTLATTMLHSTFRPAGEQNSRHGQDAVEEFKGVLTLDQQNISAIDGLGSMLFQMAGDPFDPDLFRESKSYHQKHNRFTSTRFTSPTIGLV